MKISTWDQIFGRGIKKLKNMNNKDKIQSENKSGIYKINCKELSKILHRKDKTEP